jgi:hypothetical protein
MGKVQSHYTRPEDVENDLNVSKRGEAKKGDGSVLFLLRSLWLAGAWLPWVVSRAADPPTCEPLYPPTCAGRR